MNKTHWNYFFLLIFFNKSLIESGKIPINEKDIKTWNERMSEKEFILDNSLPALT